MPRLPASGTDSARLRTARREPRPGTRAPLANRTAGNDRRGPSQRRARTCAGRSRQPSTTPQHVAESGVYLRTPESNGLRRSDTPLRLPKVRISTCSHFRFKPLKAQKAQMHFLHCFVLFVPFCAFLWRYLGFSCTVSAV